MFEVKLSMRPKSSTQIPRKRTLPNVAIGNYLPSTDQKSIIIRKQFLNNNASSNQPKKKENSTPRINSAIKNKPSARLNAQQLNNSKNQSKITQNYSNAQIRLSMLKSEQITSKKHIKTVNYKDNSINRKSAIFGEKNTLKVKLNIIKSIYTPKQSKLYNSNNSQCSITQNKATQINVQNNKKTLSKQASFKGARSKGNSFALKIDQKQDQFIQRLIDCRINKNSKQKLQKFEGQSVKFDNVSFEKIKKNSVEKISIRRSLKKKTATQSSLQNKKVDKNQFIEQCSMKDGSFQEQTQLFNIDLVKSKKLDTPNSRQKGKQKRVKIQKPFFTEDYSQQMKNRQKSKMRQSKFKQITSSQNLGPLVIEYEQKICKQAYNLASNLVIKHRSKDKSTVLIKTGAYFIDFLK